jgi:anti-sigma B factor antagonist
MNFERNNHEKYVAVASKVEKLDSTNAPDLKAVLTLIHKEGVNNVIVDLSASKYCDSSGLSALLVGNRLCKDTSGSFIICGLQPAVQKMIEISRLDSVLSLTPTFSEAEDLLFMEEVERSLSDND